MTPVEGRGFAATLHQLLDEIRELYTADCAPWVAGYSGGKDSTAVLQLIWTAIADLHESLRRKPVHVISTDTLVENPIVSAWVRASLKKIGEASRTGMLPFRPRILEPQLQDRFWVNLIGRGYPAPRHKFRWCTERLKIKPSNRFILSAAQKSGQVIVVLGTRKAESAQRAARMTQLESRRERARLSPNASLPGSLVYTPIEAWSNDEVWMYLMQHKNPWGHSNKELLSMYRGATDGGECPLVVDTSTPSCGDSRFGCWVCTLVEKDKSMAAMIQNDDEKEWMAPLLALRNRLDMPRDEERKIRDFRRLSGKVQLYEAINPDTGEREETYIPGPYTQEARLDWLRQLLMAQEHVRKSGPPHVKDLELITQDELDEIRRIWVEDKHEIEDLVPRIFEEVTGRPFTPIRDLEHPHAFDLDDMRLLRGLCEREGAADDLHFELVRALLDVEAGFRTALRRRGLYEALDETLHRYAFDDVDEAVGLARLKRAGFEAARQGLLGDGGVSSPGRGDDPPPDNF